MQGSCLVTTDYVGPNLIYGLLSAQLACLGGAPSHRLRHWIWWRQDDDGTGAATRLRRSRSALAHARTVGATAEPTGNSGGKRILENTT